MAVELEFRDGVRAVGNHVAAIMRGVDTSTMTYEEAVRESERKMLRDHLNRVQAKIIRTHFRVNGR